MNKKDSRRTFLKDAGKMAGAGLLLSSIPFLSFGQGKKKLGVALVGLGSYSTSMLGPALKETGNCYLSGVVSGSQSKAEKWAKEYGFPKSNIYNYENYDDIISNKDIDVIYVVLPNSMHAEFTIRALQAGKHVICEKPMALNAIEARVMIAAAKKANRKLSIGYRLHYDPYFIEMKRLGQESVFGEITNMECNLAYSFTPRPNTWKLKKSMGGGSLYNLGVYPIQSARHVKGSEPVYVTASVSTKRTEIFKEIDEMYTWQLEFADGSKCDSFSGANRTSDRVWAQATNGFMALDPAHNYRGQAGKSTNGVFNFPQVFQQKLQIDDFARCVMEGTQSIVPGEDGLADMLIIDAIHEAIESGGRVKIGTA